MVCNNKKQYWFLIRVVVLVGCWFSSCYCLRYSSFFLFSFSFLFLIFKNGRQRNKPEEREKKKRTRKKAFTSKLKVKKLMLAKNTDPKKPTPHLKQRRMTRMMMNTTMKKKKKKKKPTHTEMTMKHNRPNAHNPTKHNTTSATPSTAHSANTKQRRNPISPLIFAFIQVKNLSNVNSVIIVLL